MNARQVKDVTEEERDKQKNDQLYEIYRHEYDSLYNRIPKPRYGRAINP